MKSLEDLPIRLTPEPLPPNVTSTQPGGGFCYSLELAWGSVRRAWLKTARGGYVWKMQSRMRGDPEGCPHEILDPRDLKYCRNQCDAHWTAEDDPFQWRERLPFARWGLAELQIMAYPLIAIILAIAFLSPWPWLAILPAIVLGPVIWFFRDPPRKVPTEPGLIVSPADGVIAEVAHLDGDEFIGEPCVRIGVFLSIFNVHINRAPSQSRVIRLRYWPGKFLNALNPQSTLLNEAMWIGLEEEAAPHRRVVVRQIAGLFARRIVCDLRPGEVIERGHKFGMIKLGSRTEVIVPAADLEVLVKPGDKVKAGATVFARYKTTGETEIK